VKQAALIIVDVQVGFDDPYGGTLNGEFAAILSTTELVNRIGGSTDE
jgi:nicotinamidase-related amidase